jgi:hypothetical protein
MLSAGGNCFAQKLSLDDIFKAYILDSLALKSFCADKQFTIEKVSEDNWINSYTFRSAVNKNISFVRTYPKDQSADIFLFYYFDSRDDYKDFRKAAESKGFTLEKEYEVMPPGSNKSDYRERFGNSHMQLDLCTTNIGQNKYILILFRKILPKAN